MAKKIIFIDSGSGGLIFAIDAMEAMSKNYDVSNVEFLHFGDTKNIPYGTKSNEEVKKLTNTLIENAIFLKVDIIVLACNTTHAFIDNATLEKCRTSNIQIISIIEKSVEFIYNNTPIVNNEINIGMLATKSTINNKKYSDHFYKIHQSQSIKLNLFQNAPTNWVESVENAVYGQECKDIVTNGMENFKNLTTGFEKIRSFGLFCTQFPYFANEIKEYCNNLYQHDVKIISQGYILADEIAKVAELIESQKPLQQMKIVSYVTSNCIDKMHNIINKFNKNINLEIKLFP